MEILKNIHTRTLLLLIFIIPDLISKKICDSIICNEDTSQPFSDYCFKSTYNQNNKNYDINVKGCSEEAFRCRNFKDRSLWSTTKENVVTCSKVLDKKNREPFINGTLAPGEICLTNEECYSGECKDDSIFAFLNSYSSRVFVNLCQGKKENDPCTNSLECNIMLYCDSRFKVCKKQKNETQDCSTSEDCKNYMDCYEGKCTELWSKEAGTPMDASNSQFCKSSFVYNSLCQDISLIEKDLSLTEKREISKKVDCTNSEICYYWLPLKNEIISFKEGYCNCGFNKNGLAYCRHGSDSTVYNDYIIEKRKILGFKNHRTGVEVSAQCHVTKKLTCNSIKLRDIQGIKYLEQAINGNYQLADRICRLYYSSGNLNMINLLIFIIILMFI